MKKIPGYEMYSIDEQGNLFSHHVNRFVRATLRRGDVSYLKVGLLISSSPKQYKNFYIHQLVMLTHAGPCPIGMQVDHIDGNSINNLLSNLRYVDAKSNSYNRKLHGKHYKSFDRKIDFNELLTLKSFGIRHLIIADLLSVSERQVSRLLNKNKEPEL